ncbi:hypothetical protein CYMTET_46044 [Cymbomonas tetramitiformis]|uniref:Uncharacterized protein n=1 Tax=Cymbomonas tetramitiformis TaxID=36881 RepID=A0AAE0BYS1_9CHLO|nr:hypothetical protein CYMTET_46044 [Cymbomonas tetramitiformis]
MMRILKAACMLTIQKGILRLVRNMAENNTVLKWAASTEGPAAGRTRKKKGCTRISGAKLLKLIKTGNKLMLVRTRNINVAIAAVREGTPVNKRRILKRLCERVGRTRRQTKVHPNLNATGGGAHNAEDDYRFDTTTAGRFANKGQLSTYQMLQTHMPHEEKPLTALLLGGLRESLAPGTPHTKLTVQKLKRSITPYSIAVCDGKHWRKILAGASNQGGYEIWTYDSLKGHFKGVDRDFKRMHSEARTWATHLGTQLGEEVQVRQMDMCQQAKHDSHSYGVWASMAAASWYKFHRSGAIGYWPTYYKEAIAIWGPTDAKAVRNYRTMPQSKVRKTWRNKQQLPTHTTRTT